MTFWPGQIPDRDTRPFPFPFIVIIDMYWLVTRDFLVDQGFGDRVESIAPSLNRIANSVSQLPSVSQYYEENKRNGFVAMGFAF